MNSETIYKHFAQQPADRTALQTSDRSVGFDEMKDGVDQLSDRLASNGISSNSVFVDLTDDPVDSIRSFLAASKLNACYCHLKPKYSKRKIQQILSRVQPDSILVNERLRSRVDGYKSTLEPTGKPETPLTLLLDKDADEARELELPEKAFQLLFTSGTTGEQKGIIHSQQNFLRTGRSCLNAWGLDQSRQRFLSCMPLFSAATLGCIVVPSLASGHTVIMPGSRDPNRLVQAMEDHRPTFLIGTPTVFRKVSEATDPSSIEATDGELTGTVCGEKIPEDFVDRMESELSITFYPHYGMTELLAVSSTQDNGDRTTVGEPLPGVEIDIDDKDRIRVKSPTMALGRLRSDRSLPVQDGWYLTSDTGKFDEHGNLIITGRLDNCINRAGNKIFPQEIEETLYEMDVIREAAVVGISDSTYSNRIIVFVETLENSSREPIRQFASRRLDDYKIPDEILLIDSIPQNDRGKIDRQKLKNHYEREINSTKSI